MVQIVISRRRAGREIMAILIENPPYFQNSNDVICNYHFEMKHFNTSYNFIIDTVNNQVDSLTFKDLG